MGTFAFLVFAFGEEGFTFGEEGFTFGEEGFTFDEEAFTFGEEGFTFDEEDEERGFMLMGNFAGFIIYTHIILYF